MLNSYTQSRLPFSGLEPTVDRFEAFICNTFAELDAAASDGRLPVSELIDAVSEQTRALLDSDLNRLCMNDRASVFLRCAYLALVLERYNQRADAYLYSGRLNELLAVLSRLLGAVR